MLQNSCACKSRGVEKEKCGCSSRLQRKLNVGASHAPLEVEADRFAEQVLSGAHGSSQQARQIQRSTTGSSSCQILAPASVMSVLGSPGYSLEPEIQSDMSMRFGHDFSQVRVHTAADSAQSANELNAKAYTVGSDIVFGSNQYAPRSREGRRLLAHELTHVVQQSASASESNHKSENARATSEVFVQRSILSGLMDAALFIPRLFGLSVFSAEDLQEYLATIRKRKGPEDGIFSDNKARACVSRQNELGPYDVSTKTWLIQEMLGGHTSFLDENAILDLLQSSVADRQQIAANVGRDRLWSEFSDEKRRMVEALTMTASDAGPGLVARLSQLPSDEIRVYAVHVTDPALKESVRQALAIANITAPVPAGATITQAGEANLVINGVRITILPDRINPAIGEHAFTKAQYAGRSSDNQQAAGASNSAYISLTIWTEYPSEDWKRGKSAYGVGTRPQDQPTLRYHERAHGEAWLQFVRENPPPVYSGSPDMKPADLDAAWRTWEVAVAAYMDRAGNFALRAGDCTGKLPTDRELDGTGYTAAICHQH